MGSNPSLRGVWGSSPKKILKYEVLYVTFWGLSYIIGDDGVSYIFGGKGLS